MERRCGGYRVTVRQRRIAVRCHVCGPCGSFSGSAALRLATVLRGSLGRFETPAPATERRRLAEMLSRAARRIRRKDLEAL
jgi:hypothetical protein